ncbi:MAG: nicotinate (nicotinamide) nucleotide adenylyltransferase [Holophagaceae bacterium]
MALLRIGLLGGSFNPPHLGHRRLAELALQYLDLHELRVIPNHTPPHKQSASVSISQRLKMVELNFQDIDSRLRISSIEMNSPEPSYTFRTLTRLHQEEPQCSWVLILGSDAFAGFKQWQHWESILDLSRIAVAMRPGIPISDSSSIPHEILPGTELPWSSESIRDELKQQRQSQGLKTEVLSFILDQGLYTQ